MQRLLPSLGPVCAVIGAQWGDEGKGKIVDMLTEHYDVIARACGGANAGHTIVVNGTKHVFRLLPSGSLHEKAMIVLGGGMVIHLPTLLEEIDILEKAGLHAVSRLHLYPNAHIVFDYHKEIDGVLEEWRTKSKGEGIGTTKRGIGPAYMDKMARTGVRMESLHWTPNQLRAELQAKAADVKKLYGVTIDIDAECDGYVAAQKLLAGRVVANGPDLLDQCLRHEKRILIEGAQATLLDIDHGTYPFVTSSSTTLAGALQGLGLAPKRVTSCIGVAKAYCTRVGSGTFATEENSPRGDRIRERGGEYGSITGRPRRCGWLHLPDLRHTALLNGFDCWNITKLDVLDEEDEIPVGIGKDPDGTVHYETVPGWHTSTVGITSFTNLPKNAQQFMTLIERETGIPVRLIGTGRGRGEMIIRT